MKRSQFAERQYEAAVHIELALGAASPFVPTQSIEAYIGIDAAADPGNGHAIWRILSVQVPRRITLSTALWPALPRRFHDEIPGQLCSLFMQFKRPIYQDSCRAKYHSRIGGPYFEVGITGHQQEALLQLQRRVKTSAVVRYASPAFWSRVDFDHHDGQRQVLANSAFICPSQINMHRKWMYAGPNGRVILNPEPVDADGETWEAVVVEMTKVATRQTLREHIRSLAQAIGNGGIPRERLGEISWLRRIGQYGQFSEEDKALLFDLSVVALAAEAADATWVVMLLTEDGGKNLLSDDRGWMWPWPPRWW
ncbi:MAG: hypothetical protein U0795_14560 [Pirellulales bacterium]